MSFIIDSFQQLSQHKIYDNITLLSKNCPRSVVMMMLKELIKLQYFARAQGSAQSLRAHKKMPTAAKNNSSKHILIKHTIYLLVKIKKILHLVKIKKTNASSRYTPKGRRKRKGRKENEVPNAPQGYPKDTPKVPTHI